MYSKKQIGNLGENLAAKFLVSKNYLILAKNYTIYRGEVDIIAKDLATKEIVFIEVKTRTSNQFGNPEDAVNSFKKEHLHKTAERYLSENNYSAFENYRFDIISVDLNLATQKAKIHHFKAIEC